MRFDPQERDSKIPRYDILFIGTERCEVSVHFTVTEARFTTFEDGIDGSLVTFECNGGETLITASDALVIFQNDSSLLDLDTLRTAEPQR
jgi:hypothetical protein